MTRDESSCKDIKRELLRKGGPVSIDNEHISVMRDRCIELLSPAIASSKNSIQMAIAFKNAVLAGRMAYEAGLSKVNNLASATSPLTSFLNG